MILLMSACVAPPKQNNLFLSDVDERLFDYRKALAFYLSSKEITSIVFCDNSNCEIDYCAEEELAKKNNKNLEILKFSSDSNKTAIYGKGYGESVLLDYVFDNSILLVKEKYFYKVTGRLIVENIDRIIEQNGTSVIRFDRNIYSGSSFDSRFFGMPTDIYKKYFYGKEYLVNDCAVRYIEHVYKAISDIHKLESQCHSRLPDIRGRSGTAGIVYEYKGISKLINILLHVSGTYNNTFSFAFIVYFFVRYCKKKKNAQMLAWMAEY